MDTTVYYLPGSLCLREYLLKSTKGTITNFFEQAIPSCKTVHTRLTNLYLISKFKLENQSWWDSATTCPIAGSKKNRIILHTMLLCTWMIVQLLPEIKLRNLRPKKSISLAKVKWMVKICEVGVHRVVLKIGGASPQLFNLNNQREIFQKSWPS